MGRFKNILHASHPGGRKKNPYANPHNPNYNRAAPASQPNTNAGRTLTTTSAPQLPRPDSPEDLLAEAREAIGRDAVSGRLVNQQQQGSKARRLVPGRRGSLDGQRRAQDERSAYGSTAVRSGTGARYDLTIQKMQNGTFPAQDEPAESNRHSAYGNTAIKAGTGTRYDLFVKQMRGRKKREEEERMKALARAEMREPQGGYYAPPPRIPMEYYGSG